MPIIGTIFSSGGMAVAGAVSGIITFAAVLLALFTLKRTGREAYAMIKSEIFIKRRRNAKE